MNISMENNFTSVDQSWISKAWKQGITILAYKKDSDTDPVTFRPLTLQPVMSKIFTSIIRNRLYNFIAANNYIESNVQKDFGTISQAVMNTLMLSSMSSIMLARNNVIL